MSLPETRISEYIFAGNRGARMKLSLESGGSRSRSTMLHVPDEKASCAAAFAFLMQPRRRPASVAEDFRAWTLETPEKWRNGPRIFALVNSVLGDARPTVSAMIGHGVSRRSHYLATRRWPCPDIMDECPRVDEDQRLSDMIANLIGTPT